MKGLILISFFIPTILFSQGWERIIGSNGRDAGISIQQTTDGGYIITGYTGPPDSYDKDLYLIKINNAGDTIWTKTFDNGSDEWGASVKQTSDGGYIITGSIHGMSYNYSDVYLVKTDNNGDTIWSRTYGRGGNDYGSSVQQTTDGGYIITGATAIAGSASDDVYLIKTNDIGDTIWTKTIGGSNIDAGSCCKQTIDGGYIITGHTSSYGNGNRDVYLIKTDSYGDTLWTKTFDNDEWNIGCYVQQTTDGGYIVTGYSGGLVNYNDFNVFLIKTNPNGETLWTKTYGGEYEDYGLSVQQSLDGGYVIAGTTELTDSGNHDVYLIKTNSSGDTIWTKSFGHGSWDIGHSLQQTVDGGYIVVGETNSSETYSDVYIIKTDENGIITFTTEIAMPNLNRKLAKIYDLSGKEISKPVKNQPYIEIYDDGTTEKKIKIK